MNPWWKVCFEIAKILILLYAVLSGRQVVVKLAQTMEAVETQLASPAIPVPAPRASSSVPAKSGASKTAPGAKKPPDTPPRPGRREALRQ